MLAKRNHNTENVSESQFVSLAGHTERSRKIHMPAIAVAEAAAHHTLKNPSVFPHQALLSP